MANLYNTAYIPEDQNVFVESKSNETFPYVSSNFTYPLLSKRRMLPCLATVRIVRKVDCGTYWVIDKSVLIILNDQIAQPLCGLLPDIEVGKSFACIASVVRPGKDCAQPMFCRAVASNFNKCDGSCTVFLIDYGEIVATNVYSLFNLNGQPPVVFEAPGAAFLCVIKQRSQSYQRYAKLIQDESYLIEIFTVDENEKFSALLYNLSPLEILSDFSENELFEEPARRGSMLRQWTHANEGSGEKSLKGPGCLEQKISENENDEFVNEVKEVKSVRVAVALSKLETKIDFQYMELSRKLDELLHMHLIHEQVSAQNYCKNTEALLYGQYGSVNNCDNNNCKQNRCSFRKHSNRNVRARNYSSYSSNSVFCTGSKGVQPRFQKQPLQTIDSSTQTCLGHGDSCISGQSLATTTCSSTCEVEMEDNPLYASDTYSLTSPNKVAEKDLESNTMPIFPNTLSTLFSDPQNIPQQKYREKNYNLAEKYKQQSVTEDELSSGMRCWICGKSGSLTRYCVAEPSVFSCLCGNVVKEVSTTPERATPRRKRVKKEVLYTSEESSSEDSEEDSFSDNSCCDIGRAKYC